MDNNREIKFRGKVLGGRGEAQGFLKIDWVREQCFAATGFEPYPGTLNLKVDHSVFELLRRTAISRGKKIIPPTGMESFCEARLLPLVVDGIRGALLYPMLDDYYNNIVEVIAPVLFKEREGVRDGTFLELLLPPLQKLSCPGAVIFDLDGTLIDSVDLYYSILCEGCLHLELKTPPKDIFLEFMGKGQGFWEGWPALTGSSFPEKERDALKNEVISLFEEIWQRRYEQEVMLFSGVDTLLLQLQKKGIKIGVVTSSYYIKKMELFRRAGLDPESLFSAVITREDTIQKKPHPEPFYRCLQKLEIPATGCISMGDSPCDMEAGRKAGLFTVGVLSGVGTVQSLSKAGADVLLDSVVDFLGLID